MMSKVLREAIVFNVVEEISGSLMVDIKSVDQPKN